MTIQDTQQRGPQAPPDEVDAVVRPRGRPPRSRVNPDDGRVRVSAAETIYGTLVALVVGALLGSGSLVGLAERQPFGTGRDVALSTARGVDRVANLVSLNRPADIAAGLLGRTRETYDLTVVAAGGETPGETTPSTLSAAAAEPAADTAAPDSSVLDQPTVPSTATVTPEVATTAAADSVPPSSTDVRTSTVSVAGTSTSLLPSATGVAPTPEVSVTPTAPVADAGPRTVTAEAPLRLWIGGDSMVRELGTGVVNAVDPALVQPEVHFRVSSGLTRPDFYDWPQRIAQAVVEEQPDAFVIMFGANDNQNLETEAGVIDRGTPEWAVEYGRRVGMVMDLMNRSDMTTVWVGQPVMRSATFSAAMGRMNAIYREQAASRERVLFLDTSQLLTDADGAYAKFLPDAGGNQVLMRQDDGVHLSRQGAERTAEAVWAAVASQWGIQR